MAQYDAEIKSRCKLSVIAKGGALMDEVNCIDREYSSPKEATIAEARRLMVNEIQRLMILFNSDNVLRPYMHNFPMDQNNFHYGISFATSKNKPKHDKSVGYVFLLNGIIYYCALDLQQDRLTDLHEETFQDALRIVVSEDKARVTLAR